MARAFERSTASQGVDVVGLSQDSLPEAQRYASVNALHFPLASFPDRRAVVLSKATAVPVTLLVDPDGRVLYARLGAVLDDSVRDTIMAITNARPLATSQLRSP